MQARIELQYAIAKPKCKATIELQLYCKPQVQARIEVQARFELQYAIAKPKCKPELYCKPELNCIMELQSLIASQN